MFNVKLGTCCLLFNLIICADHRWVQDTLPVHWYGQHNWAFTLPKQTEVWWRTNGRPNQLWWWPHDQNEQIVCHSAVSDFQKLKPKLLSSVSLSIVSALALNFIGQINCVLSISCSKCIHLWSLWRVICKFMQFTEYFSHYCTKKGKLLRILDFLQ